MHHLAARQQQCSRHARKEKGQHVQRYLPIYDMVTVSIGCLPIAVPRATGSGGSHRPLSLTSKGMGSYSLHCSRKCCQHVSFFIF
jgi:hypothetical protein